MVKWEEVRVTSNGHLLSITEEAGVSLVIILRVVEVKLSLRKEGNVAQMDRLTYIQTETQTKKQTD